ncbi:PASTA domain-containing protein [Rhodococcus pyridinivorans]|uniref:PASTA domain-containing protein n=1 Tax=Rhodococcus pyridinivorans TaxID=103816 RepID=UPI00200B124E|nr:PASTA domain-containing protein [Rhodococcus pyridinivorans]UPW06468.1 PASTA domain-containing protein [Rhodococcus pyridinivorans]
MKFVVPYLRVVAGMFAAITLWLAIVEVVNGNLADAILFVAFAAGLGYLAIGKPLRDHRRRIKAEQDAIAARAEVGHRAFLAGDVRAAMAPPPEPPKPPRIRRGVVIAAAVAGLIVLMGIIGDISDGLDSPTKDDASTTPRAAAPTTTTPYTTSAATTARTVAPETTPATRVSTTQVAAVASTAVMPNVVCMDLQAAQDTIQAAGVFYSTSVDATGQGRAQVWDRNWVVVDQTPSAGASIGEGDPVLSVLKEDEFSGC